MSMAGEFVRTELLIGREGLETLENASILVFGVGGVGSHCIEALARCGVGRLILADSDSVAQSNINRQAVAFQDTVGLPKTQDRKSTRLNSSHGDESRMPSSA